MTTRFLLNVSHILMYLKVNPPTLPTPVCCSGPADARVWRAEGGPQVRCGEGALPLLPGDSRGPDFPQTHQQGISPNMKIPYLANC